MRSGDRGFTLIELLVVISIIGLLSSIVLSALDSARNKGADANVISNLDNIRVQAELYYDTHNNYATIARNNCTQSATMFVNDSSVQNMIAAAESANGSATITCRVTTTAAGGWAVGSLLKSGSYYCVDSTGEAIVTSTNTISAAGDIILQFVDPPRPL